jgi:hypothetical protein
MMKVRNPDAEYPSHEWARQFVQKHPELSVKKAVPLESERADACTTLNLGKWFEDKTKEVKPKRCDFEDLSIVAQ